MSTKAHPKKLNVYLSIDSESIQKYFNPNDPAPFYRRQLSHDFQEYLNSSIAMAGRNTEIQYKMFCGEANGMRFLMEPLVQTIKRHFEIKRQIAEAQFNKFKRKNYILLCVSICVVMFCQGLLPVIFNQDHRIHSMFSNALDVFSWVILWKPIERLIFYWNPFLKEILLYKKMATAEVIFVDNEQELINHHMELVGAA
jgi:hypothetical protein